MARKSVLRRAGAVHRGKPQAAAAALEAWRRDIEERTARIEAAMKKKPPKT